MALENIVGKGGNAPFPRTFLPIHEQMQSTEKHMSIVLFKILQDGQSKILCVWQWVKFGPI